MTKKQMLETVYRRYKEAYNAYHFWYNRRHDGSFDSEACKSLANHNWSAYIELEGLLIELEPNTDWYTRLLDDIY